MTTPQPINPAPSMAQVTQGRGCGRWFFREGRLRSGWRVSLYVVAALLTNVVGELLLGLVLTVVVGLPLSRAGVPQEQIKSQLFEMVGNFFNYPWLALSIEGERLALILALVWVFRRFVDRRSFRSLGFQFDAGWWRQLLAGFIFIVAAWALIFACAMVIGAAVVTGFAWEQVDWLGMTGSLALGLVFNLLVGVTEETDGRGYVLHNLEEGNGIVPAVLVSSLYFGALHLLNPGGGWTSTIGIFIAGILLSLGVYATGRLWFSIGMHAAWNFAEGPLFGFLVSGLNMGGLLRLKITGPDWLMGGAFGPEAGVLSVAIQLVMIVILIVWARRKSAIGRANVSDAVTGSVQ